uniref:Nuclear RNA export factor 1-like n=1 Tax=Hirondellea gigas TaxID=1518452 RepID=A0A2P2HZA0_9CRUS
MAGRKKHRLMRRLAVEASYEKGRCESSNTYNHETGSHNVSAKNLSKKHKKSKHCKKKHQITVTNEHHWYLVKVYDSVPPTKAFLEESFRTLLDTDFLMLGFHHSTSSTRFYLENNSAAAHTLKGMNKRMQGSTSRLMQIQIEPCQSFLVLNAQQLSLAKQVLERRYDAALNILNLSHFHHDPLFLENNILPVLWDPAIFKQILSLVRDNIPNLSGIDLRKNSLRLVNVRVLAGTLRNCPIQGINLEQNDIENIKELITVLSVFPVVELKLEGNNCLKDIRNPVLYIKTVQSKLSELKTLDGVDVLSYLVKSAAKDGDTTASISKVFDGSGASTSAAAISPKVEVTEMLVQQFLTEYFTCMDTEQRMQLVNAYSPTASVTITSEVQGIPTVCCEGHAAISQILSNFPATQHIRDSFNFKLISLEPTSCQVAVTGKLRISGREEHVTFEQNFVIQPYNSGLGCIMSRLSLR